MQPQGPYRLVGYSFGGIVAFEVAQQITAQGDRVSLLGFFDTIEWHYLENVNRSLNPSQRLKIYKARLGDALSSEERFSNLRELIKRQDSPIRNHNYFARLADPQLLRRAQRSKKSTLSLAPTIIRSCIPGP